MNSEESSAPRSDDNWGKMVEDLFGIEIGDTAAADELELDEDLSDITSGGEPAADEQQAAPEGESVEPAPVQASQAASDQEDLIGWDVGDGDEDVAELPETAPSSAQADDAGSFRQSESTEPNQSADAEDEAEDDLIGWESDDVQTEADEGEEEQAAAEIEEDSAAGGSDDYWDPLASWNWDEDSGRERVSTESGRERRGGDRRGRGPRSRESDRERSDQRGRRPRREEREEGEREARPRERPTAASRRGRPERETVAGDEGDFGAGLLDTEDVGEFDSTMPTETRRDDEERPPRKRRRRRRGRRGSRPADDQPRERSDDAELDEGEAELDEADEEAFAEEEEQDALGEDRPRRRRRRRTRRRQPAERQDLPESVSDEETETTFAREEFLEDDEDSVEDLQPSYANVPSWEAAIALLVKRNPDPRGGDGDRGRRSGRGPRSQQRRGRRRSS